MVELTATEVLEVVAFRACWEGLVIVSAPKFLRDCPQSLFFTGKGGVGKTSIASASAVHLADEGKRVLLVSTDPASNLAEVLATRIGHRLTAIPGVVGLTAIEIDPELAAVAYRERILSPLTGQLPEAELTAAREQLSGSCTTEVAAFDEFTSYLADPQVIADYEAASGSPPASSHDAMPATTDAAASTLHSDDDHPVTDARHGPSLKEQVEAFERGLVARALESTGGNQSEAARRLGVSRVTLIDKMKKYHLGQKR